MRLGMKGEPQSLYRSHDPASNEDILGGRSADDLRLVAEQQRAALHIALDLAIDLDVALRNCVAGNGEVLTDDGRSGLAGTVPRHSMRPPGQGQSGVAARALRLVAARLCLFLFVKH